MKLVKLGVKRKRTWVSKRRLLLPYSYLQVLVQHSGLEAAAAGIAVFLLAECSMKCWMMAARS